MFPKLIFTGFQSLYSDAIRPISESYGVSEQDARLGVSNGIACLTKPYPMLKKVGNDLSSVLCFWLRTMGTIQ